MAKQTTAVAKTKSALSSTGKSIANNPQTALYIGVGIVAVLALYSISKVAIKVGDVNFGNNPTDGGGNPNPNSPTTRPYGATITKNQAQTIAAGLHQAMVVWYGTDHKKIYELLSGKNAKDYAMISEAFGQPRYDDMGDAWWPFPKKNLTYWIHSELNNRELAHLKSIMPGVL